MIGNFRKLSISITLACVLAAPTGASALTCKGRINALILRAGEVLGPDIAGQTRLKEATDRGDLKTAHAEVCKLARDAANAMQELTEITRGIQRDCGARALGCNVACIEDSLASMQATADKECAEQPAAQ